jgi:hypothetical protein
MKNPIPRAIIPSPEPRLRTIPGPDVIQWTSNPLELCHNNKAPDRMVNRLEIPMYIE